MRQAILNCHFNRSIETFQPSLHNRKALSVAERKGDWLLLAGLDFLSPIPSVSKDASLSLPFASRPLLGQQKQLYLINVSFPITVNHVPPSLRPSIRISDAHSKGF